MADLIQILNGSNRIGNEFIMSMIDEIRMLRPVDTDQVPKGALCVKQAVKDVYQPKRDQADIIELANELHSRGLHHIMEPKLIVTDTDLYGANAHRWCFGGFIKEKHTAGYLILSSARLDTESLARIVFRHELGHLFGAPRKGRTDTYELLGTHCSRSNCTMQQCMSVEEAKQQARRIESSGAYHYCPQCTNDIIAHEPR
jgi:hypothetical protein